MWDIFITSLYFSINIIIHKINKNYFWSSFRASPVLVNDALTETKLVLSKMVEMIFCLSAKFILPIKVFRSPRISLLRWYQLLHLWYRYWSGFLEWCFCTSSSVLPGSSFNIFFTSLNSDWVLLILKSKPERAFCSLVLSLPISTVIHLIRLATCLTCFTQMKSTQSTRHKKNTNLKSEIDDHIDFYETIFQSHFQLELWSFFE